MGAPLVQYAFRGKLLISVSLPLLWNLCLFNKLDKTCVKINLITLAYMTDGFPSPAE